MRALTDNRQCFEEEEERREAVKVKEDQTQIHKASRAVGVHISH